MLPTHPLALDTRFSRRFDLEPGATSGTTFALTNQVHSLAGADIEAPSPTLDTPAYHYFARLGFRRPYARRHWRLP